MAPWRLCSWITCIVCVRARSSHIPSTNIYTYYVRRLEWQTDEPPCTRAVYLFICICIDIINFFPEHYIEHVFANIIFLWVFRERERDRDGDRERENQNWGDAAFQQTHTHAHKTDWTTMISMMGSCYVSECAAGYRSSIFEIHYSNDAYFDSGFNVLGRLDTKQNSTKLIGNKNWISRVRYCCLSPWLKDCFPSVLRIIAPFN